MSIPLLVSVDWQAAHLDDSSVRVADTRWYLLDKEKHGREEYLRGHIPGAVFFDIDSDLSSPRGIGPGRHPLPRMEVFIEIMSCAGIGSDTHVIAYDDQGGATAARLWWLLRYFGHTKVSLLDGGISRWITEGRPLETHVPSYPRTEFTAQIQPDSMVNKGQVAELLKDPHTLVIDSRATERYEGRLEPIDTKAGHIPGAKNAPLAGNLRGTDDMRFLLPRNLHKRYEHLGAGNNQRLVVYCGSGITACGTIFALHLAGYYKTLLYEGSWSDWCSDPTSPIAIGPNP